MPSTRPKHYGAAAVGSSGSFDVEIDEALDDANDLQMGISTRGWSFRFVLSTRNDMARLLAFLKEHAGRLEFSELVVGSFHGVPVRLIKDHEFADRFWIRAHGSNQIVEFALAADDLAEFTDAVAQAVQDLQS